MLTRKQISLLIVAHLLTVACCIASLILLLFFHRKPEKPVFTEFPTIASAVEYYDDVEIVFETANRVYLTQYEEDEPFVEYYIDEKYAPDFSGNVNEFFEVMGPHAVRLWKEYGILPSLTLAQAAMESGFGVAGIGWNLCGVKACCQTGDITNEFSYVLNGDVCTAGYCTNHPTKTKSHLWTKEERNGVLQKEKHWFAYYTSVNEFLAARYKVLSNETYYPGLIGESDYVAATNKVKRYATLSNYPAVLRNMIEEYNLTVWDPGGERYED